MIPQSDKNILFITNLHLWSIETGKGGKAFYHTINGFIEDKWNVTLISTGGGIPEDIRTRITVIENKFSLLEKLQKYDSKLISIFARFLKMWLTTHFFVKASRRIIEKLDSNNIIIYSYEVDAVAASKKVAMSYNLPLVTRFQGTVLSNIKDNWLNRLRRAPHFSALKTNADLVIMTNDGTQGDRTLARLRNSSRKIVFWRNGVDKPHVKGLVDRGFVRKRWNVPLSCFVFVTVSRLINWKRVHIAIESFAQIATKHPESHLLIVGDGPEMESLQTLAIHHKLKEQITFTGSIHHEEVKLILSASDVFLSFYDLSNLGNPLMEAMVAGLPIITIDVGDTHQLVVHCSNGILIGNDELERIPIEMQRLITDSDLRVHIANGAINTAEMEFWSWEKRIQEEVFQIKSLLR
jgi:glycosyltransferase involved in cell wall biosynthesis